MKTLRTSRPINPKTLNPKTKKNLIHELYRIHSQIFDGVDVNDFRKYVVDPPSISTTIRFFINQAGEKVGYITTQVFETETIIKGKTQTPFVYRTEVGMLPKYRGNNATLKILFWDFFKGYLKRGMRESWFVATPIHPNPYCSAAKQLFEVYPNPKTPTPRHIFDMMGQLSTSFGIETKGSSHSFQCKVGWIVKNLQEHRSKPEASQDPFVQFYLQQNPAFREGTGMMMMVPFRWMNAYWAVGNMIRKKLKRAFRESTIFIKLRVLSLMKYLSNPWAQNIRL